MRSKLLGALLVSTLACTLAAAQASRTWVSGVGNDANPCSRTAPCKTFAGAISKTAAGGEIDALDPAGYGALTITKSITIDGGGGQVASVLVAGTNAIVVSAGASDVVILRNLRLNGLRNTATPGINGIDFKTAGTLIVENCDVFGFGTNGIWMESASNGHLVVRNTTSNNMGSAGIRVESGVASVENSDVSANAYGLIVFTGKVTAKNVMASQDTSRAFHAGSGELNLFDSTASNSAIGVSSSGGTVRISNVTVTDNTTGLSITAGQVISWQNNHIAANGTSSPPSSTIGPH